MIEIAGVDYSWEHPPVSEIIGKGYKFALRYVSYDGPPKNITPGELKALHDAGIRVGFVWESTGVTPEGGAGAGAREGHDAGIMLDSLGVPRSVPIFWTFDTDPAGDPPWQQQLSAYGQAFHLDCNRVSLPYGSGAVIDFFQCGWQTQAWSGSYVSPHAQIYQRAGNAKIAGTDEDVITQSGLWCVWPPLSPAPVPSPESPIDMQLAKVLPDITGSDHTHPKALLLWRQLMQDVNPHCDVSSDAATLHTTEDFRAFFKVQGDRPGRIGLNMWAAALTLAVIQPK